MMFFEILKPENFHEGFERGWSWGLSDSWHVSKYVGSNLLPKTAEQSGYITLETWNIKTPFCDWWIDTKRKKVEESSEKPI